MRTTPTTSITKAAQLLFNRKAIAPAINKAPIPNCSDLRNSALWLTSPIGAISLPNARFEVTLYVRGSRTLGHYRPRLVTQFALTGDGRQNHARILSMKPDSKKLGTSPIGWSLVWALAIMATAFLFKGNPAYDWIEAGLVGLALTFVVLKPQRPVCLR
jgi:hypothetical protein